MLYFSDVFEVNGVRDLEALHSISMSPFLEMSFKCSSAPVGSSSADFAFEFNTEAMQFIQPIRNWFSIPAHGQVFWIILRFVFIIIFLIRILHSWENVVFLFSLHLIFIHSFIVASGLLLSYQVLSVINDVSKQIFESHDPCFKPRYSIQLIYFILSEFTTLILLSLQALVYLKLVILA